MIWENDNTKGKINSVKQEYDETKRKYYLKQVEYVDRKLAGYINISKIILKKMKL